MRAVNLLPRDAARAKRGAPGVPVLLAAAAPLAVLALIFLAYTVEHSPVHGKEAQLKRVQAQVAALPPSALPKAQNRNAIALERIARRSALDAVLINRVPWDLTMVSLARVLPQDVWLTSLGLTSPTPADQSAPTTTSNGTAFSINGYTYSEDSVARLLTRLQLLPMLSNVTLGTTTAQTVGQKPVVQFTVTAVIAPSTAGEGT